MRTFAAILGVALAASFAAAAHAQQIPIISTTLPAAPTTPHTSPILHPVPSIITGNPDLPNNPNAFTAINFNTPDSPLAGVVSVYSAFSATSGVRGSGVVLDRTHILTAAHVVDFQGGADFNNQVTGDGTVDALLPYSRVFVNSIAVPEPVFIQSIAIHPAWHGFDNVAAPDGGSLHDDLAILTLSTPLPASVPAYPVYQTPFHQDFGKILLMTGYGGGGDEENGITQPATVEVKRYGWNLTVTYEFDEESLSFTRSELYLADFDGSNEDGEGDFRYLGFDSIGSLGNDYESTIAPGDSGGPAFLITDRNNNGFVEADELTIFGLTTFTFDTTDGSWPHFGSAFGGPILSAYTEFIGTYVAIPEPSSLLLLSGSIPLLMRRRR